MLGNLVALFFTLATELLAGVHVDPYTSLLKAT